MSLNFASIFTGLSGVAQVFSGIQANKAAQSQARAQENQSQITLNESIVEAKRIDRENRIFKKRQKLAFLKNGITLEGSPLLVLEETRKLGKEEVASILRSGRAKSQFLFSEAKTIRRQGRAQLIGSALGGISTFGKLAVQNGKPNGNGGKK